MELFDGNKIITVKEVEIPKVFYNSETKKPFNECALCGKDLLHTDEFYFVEKAYEKKLTGNKHELIFEYAMCSECQVGMSEELSKESMQNIAMYFRLYTEDHKIPETDEEIKQNYTNCLVRNKNVKEFREYQRAGIFMNDKMLILNHFPFAFGSYAIDEIQELISEKTRNFLNGLKDKIIPPEVRDKVPDDRLIFV